MTDRCWCSVVHPAGWIHSSGAQAAFQPVHAVGEEDDQPACWTTDDAPWGTTARITHNPAKVTCPACRAVMEVPAGAITAAAEAMLPIVDAITQAGHERGHAQVLARAALAAAAPAIAAQATAAERERIRHRLLDGDPCALEARFRDLVDDDEAADCAGIVADLLGAP